MKAMLSNSTISYYKKKTFILPTMGGVILRVGPLTEPWESDNMPEDLCRS